MIANRIKEIWSRGQPVLNGWLSIGNGFTAEIMAAQGFDSLTIDAQHGALSAADLIPMMQAMRASGVVPMVRVSWVEPGIIMKALDAGAYGIICPMVNSASDAAEFVRHLRYPPRGERSFGPTRASYAAGANYAAEANDQIIGLAMIETRDAMENLDAIAATPGLDGLYIGPVDLSLSLSQGALPPGFDREEPEIVAAIRRVREAAHDNGIRAGLHCGTPEYAARAIGWGFDMVTVGGDARFLAMAAGASVARFRAIAGTDTAS
jgi:4-hydroxy-2-oxoheptanedioate aldolase